MKSLALGVVSLALLAASPAWPHHSFAVFDRSRQVTLNGVVKDFQWTNPHSWIQLLVKDPSGKDVEWSIEGGSPNALGRNGWTRTSLKVGDRVSVVVAPLRDGTHGGWCRGVTLIESIPSSTSVSAISSRSPSSGTRMSASRCSCSAA